MFIGKPQPAKTGSNHITHRSQWPMHLIVHVSDSQRPTKFTSATLDLVHIAQIC